MGFVVYLAVTFVALSLCGPTYSLGYVSHKERIKLREEARHMFYHAYENYMENAYPLDELKPLSCTGRGSEGRGSLDDVLGGFSLTLIDTLDTLVVLEDFEEFERASRLVIKHVTFNRNVVVSVFETTIRVLGGLLSAHLMSVEHVGKLKKGYNGEFLKMATELGNRLLPAFNTPTRIPYSRVNLMMGIPRGESPETCTAGAGTLILEFGLLSRLTGDPIYMDVARRALMELWRRRSTLNLVGNVINVNTGQWIRADSSIGAGIDSFFEYLLKGYILFGDHEFYEILVQAYNSIEKYTKKGPWYVSVHMANGNVVREWVESLEMFWPGLQVTLGQLGPAIENFNAFYQLWRRYGLPPEAYAIPTKTPVPGVSGYPLRPEMIESAYLLFSATNDHAYIIAGKQMMHNIVNYTRVECGFAAVSDVLTKKLEDRFDSYFLSETCKYLYLLFDPDHPTRYRDTLFTTEGHLVPLRYGYHDPLGQPSPSSLMCKNPIPPRDTPLFPSTSHHVTRETTKPKNQSSTTKGQPQAQKFPNVAQQFSTQHQQQFLQQQQQIQQLQQILQQEPEEFLDEPARTVVEAQLLDGHVAFLAVSANFGPEIDFNFEAKLIYGTPADGCTPLIHPVITNPKANPKTIVMLDRGICMFGEKIRTAMNSGVHGVIVVDNIDQPNVFLMTDGLSGTGAPEVTIPSILVNKTMGDKIKEALFQAEDEYMITLRPARDDEIFAEEEQFYQAQNTLALNIPFGQGLTKDVLAEAVLQQLQQMQIKLDGQFQIQYIDANNQPAILTVQADTSTKTVVAHTSPPVEKITIPDTQNNVDSSETSNSKNEPSSTTDSQESSENSPKETSTNSQKEPSTTPSKEGETSELKNGESEIKKT